ncbi:hypothetical protein L21SP5_01066 [Salinivirga cyanobacteriivorans]|uniref:Uncharacterized protein n=1 Tax=Salinivirga cyanobacteriivorans TaxID=1307839 RepID=A0A0S2HY61_9BACT|nr:hypothetical protein L21SP5_01066 [Salinivirga cyanobacteriivorans]
MYLIIQKAVSLYAIMHYVFEHTKTHKGHIRLDRFLMFLYIFSDL